MSKYVIDSYAWIEYIDGTQTGRELQKLLEKNEEVYTSVITVAEVVSKAARRNKDAKLAYDILLNNSQIVRVDEELSWAAGLLHTEMRKTEKDFGLADAYVLATARKLKAKILTGDPHFKNVKDAILM